MVFPIVGGQIDVPELDVSNSLRFNDGDDPELNFTPGSAVTAERKTFTVSCWVKLGILGSTRYIWEMGGADAATTRFFARFDSNDKLNVNDSGTAFRITNRVFRDPSAWYHIVVAVDTTDGTAGDRIKIYVNGVQETSFGTTNNPSQDDQKGFSHDSEHTIGRSGIDDTASFDGYIAEFYAVGASQLEATSFGKNNENGVWIPIKYSGSYGTNGFKLEFKQTGTSQNSSGIGADTSGNDNHFSVANLAALDVTTDTPTNNFCTMNPLGQGGGSLAEGNLKETTDDNAGCPATFAVSNGKWYWEVKIEAGSNNLIGIADADYYGLLAASPNNYRIVLYQADGRVFNMGTTAQGGDSGRIYDTNDIMGIRLDLDSGTRTIKWYEDDSLIATENIGASQVLVTPFSSKGGSSQTCSYNFGNPAFSISSGNADANGYGNYEYAVPSGHYALCTKNLAKYGG